MGERVLLLPLVSDLAFEQVCVALRVSGMEMHLIVGKMVDAIEEGITERKNNKDLVQEEEEEEIDEMKENNEEEENKDERRPRTNRRPRKPVAKN